MIGAAPQHLLQAVVLSHCAGAVSLDGESPGTVDFGLPLNGRFDGLDSALLDGVVDVEDDPAGSVRLRVGVAEDLWAQQS